jgi:hypothetical protein
MSADATPEGATARPAKTARSADQNPCSTPGSVTCSATTARRRFVLDRGQGCEVWDTRAAATSTSAPASRSRPRPRAPAPHRGARGRPRSSSTPRTTSTTPRTSASPTSSAQARLRSRLLLQLGRGGDRGAAQARAPLLLRNGEASRYKPHRVPQRVPRPHPGRGRGDRAHPSTTRASARSRASPTSPTATRRGALRDGPRRRRHPGGAGAG